jgi:uncharacterized protein
VYTILGHAMSIVWAALLALTVCTGWLLNWLSLPGNWLIVLSVAAYAWWGPADGRLAIGWPVVVVLAVLSALGEVIEFAAGAAGVARAGGSRRAALLALGGSLVGSVIGALVGVPIPLVGSLVGILLGAALGALFGAALGEYWKGRDASQSWLVGHAAFWGRLLGTGGKLLIGAVLVAIVFSALLV